MTISDWSDDARSLLTALESQPEDWSLMLVLADALDECGLCGPALRWASRHGATATKMPGDSNWRWAFYTRQDDWWTWAAIHKGNIDGYRHWLPYQFYDEEWREIMITKGAGTSFENCWDWIQRKFASFGPKEIAEITEITRL